MSKPARGLFMFKLDYQTTIKPAFKIASDLNVSEIIRSSQSSQKNLPKREKENIIKNEILRH